MCRSPIPLLVLSPRSMFCFILSLYSLIAAIQAVSLLSSSKLTACDPFSRYASLLTDISLRVLREAKIEPPIQTASFLYSELSNPQPQLFGSVSPELASLAKRSLNPGRRVLPPAKTTFLRVSHLRNEMEKSHCDCS